MYIFPYLSSCFSFLFLRRCVVFPPRRLILFFSSSSTFNFYPNDIRRLELSRTHTSHPSSKLFFVQLPTYLSIFFCTLYPPPAGASLYVVGVQNTYSIQGEDGTGNVYEIWQFKKAIAKSVWVYKWLRRCSWNKNRASSFRTFVYIIYANTSGAL